jgi:hypothetical protein
VRVHAIVLGPPGRAHHAAFVRFVVAAAAGGDDSHFMFARSLRPTD